MPRHWQIPEHGTAREDSSRALQKEFATQSWSHPSSFPQTSTPPLPTAHGRADKASKGHTDGSWHNGSCSTGCILACMLKQPLTEETIPIPKHNSKRRIALQVQVGNNAGPKESHFSLNALSKALAEAAGQCSRSPALKCVPLCSPHSEPDARLNHHTPGAVVQSSSWQMPAQISALVFLKSQMAFGVLHSSEELADDAGAQLRCMARRQTPPAQPSHLF